jgi:hypothetical protein
MIDHGPPFNPDYVTHGPNSQVLSLGAA